MLARFTPVALAVLALAAAVSGSAPASEWHSFRLDALAYGTHGKCSHPAADVSGVCEGAVGGGSFEGHALGGRVRWVWSHHGGTLEIVGRGFELRGSFPHQWSSFTVSSAAFGGQLLRSGTHLGGPGKPGSALLLVLLPRTTTDASGRKIPGYALTVTGFLEPY